MPATSTTDVVPEFRHLRSGSLNIPSQQSRPNGIMSPIAGTQRFDGPRSPPNTAHVPCKFFRQGACQAGNACPFSHDLSNASENVCKYFAKGNCKFGPKCANIHVLPDGRRINYGKNGVTFGAAGINLGSRVNPTTFQHPASSALTNSFMRADGVPPPQPYNGADGSAAPAAGSSFPTADDRFSLSAGRQNHHLGRQPSMENGLPTIDTTYSSNPASAYGGSPRDDESLNRFGLGLSPINVKGGLSVLDAPLPASFDSNGISHAARYGPWPSSVPNKFGLESPSTSVNAAKDARTSETLKLLHTSAFGSNDRLSSPPLMNHPVSSSLAATMIGGGNGLGGFTAAGSSPPAYLASDEFFGGAKRATVMHSASARFAKPRVLSASAPKVDRDWEAEFVFLEEDCVPSSLANDVLTPQEKARRGSMRQTEDQVPAVSGGVGGGWGPEGLPSSLPKFGSLGSAMAASPSSRWSPVFQRQREEEADSSPAGHGRAMKHHAASVFGHVGSPLRNSSLAMDAAELNGLSRRTSGPTNTNGNGIGAGAEPLSVLTQQLRQTSLRGGDHHRNGDDSLLGNGNGVTTSPHLHPNAARLSGGPVPSFALGRGVDQPRERVLERHVSSGSIGSSGRFTTPIDEEDPSFVFSMEEDDAHSAAATQTTPTSAAHTHQRTTSGGGLGAAPTPPNTLRPSRRRIPGGGGLGVGGWSYAGVVAAATAASHSATAKGVNGSSGPGPVAKSTAGGVVETVGGR